MKLEVGMFARTPKGIAKIETIEEDRTEIYFNCDTGLSISFIKKDFTQEEMAKFYKHSHNIIDLIEVGDVISYEFPTGLGMIGYENVTVLPELLNILQNGENNHEYIIKSIVTKEQFESMSYKV